MQLNKQQIEDAREWLLDCFDDEYDQEEIAAASDEVIIKAVKRYHYDGIAGFLDTY